MAEDDTQHVRKLIPEVEEIKDVNLREKVVKAWIVAWRRGHFDHIEDLAYDYGNVPLYQHIRAVVRICIASADILEQLHGLKFNRDHLIAAALLHDIDKYITTTLDNNGNKTRDTRFVHGYIQAKIAQDLDMSDEIAHAVLVHSARRFTIDRPQTLEAVLVQDADMVAMNPLVLHDKTRLRGEQ